MFSLISVIDPCDAGADSNSIADFNPVWIAEFKRTNAYEVWQRVTDPMLFDIVEPRYDTFFRCIPLPLLHSPYPNALQSSLHWPCTIIMLTTLHSSSLSKSPMQRTSKCHSRHLPPSLRRYSGLETGAAARTDSGSHLAHSQCRIYRFLQSDGGR